MSKLITVVKEQTSKDLDDFIKRVEHEKQEYDIFNQQSGGKDPAYPQLMFYPEEVHEHAKEIITLIMENRFLIPPPIVERKLDAFGYIPSVDFIYQIAQEIWVEIYTALCIKDSRYADDVIQVDGQDAYIKFEDSRHPYNKHWVPLQSCEMVKLKMD